jgi:predicted nicotinamide N-methyase
LISVRLSKSTLGEQRVDLVTRAVELPGGDLRVLQPREASELPDEREIEWAPVGPYWPVLWRSGVTLARELDGEALAGLRVVELGCGLAIPSLAAARAGADVLATDNREEAPPFAARNAEMNGLRIDTATADWWQPEALVERGPFDLVLASDVLYVEVDVDPLLELLPRLARRAWLADPGRAPAKEFLKRAASHWSIETHTRGLIQLHSLKLA